MINQYTDFYGKKIDIPYNKGGVIFLGSKEELDVSYDHVLLLLINDATVRFFKKYLY